MMCIQYFSFFLAYLTSILISRKDEIAHIMITIDLALLIIHTLNCRVYHFLAIKFPDFYRQLRIWYKGTKCINPKKCIVYPTLHTGWTPSIRSGAVFKPRLTITRFSMTSGMSICASCFQYPLHILPQFHFPFGKHLVLACHGDANMLRT